jgi:hypothetical protein
LKSSILSYWSDDQYFDIRKSLGQIKEIQQNPSGRFNTNFKIKIQSNPGLNQISNIKLKSFYYDFKNLKSTDLQTHYLIKDSGAKEILDMNPASTEYIPATTYPIFTNEILNTVILKQIINRSEVGMEFEDFEYKILGKSLSYSKIIVICTMLSSVLGMILKNQQNVIRFKAEMLCEQLRLQLLIAMIG